MHAKKKYLACIFISIIANHNQCLKALIKAKSYKGPFCYNLLYLYINHGLKVGMKGSIEEEKKAVECGYWNLFRFNPALKSNKLTIDFKTPTKNYEDFLLGEVRYSALLKSNEAVAKELFEKAKEQAANKKSYLEKLEKIYE